MATTTPQPLTALARANTVRIEAAEIKRELRAGQIELGEALDDPRAASLTVTTALLTQHRIGLQKAGTIINRLMMSPNRRVSQLTAHQKAQLAAEVQR